MEVIVQKFGGTSVGTAERILNVARRVKARAEEGLSLVVVVSAMGDTTDELLEVAAAVCSRPVDREVDALLATGEQVSSALLALALNDMGCPAVSLTGLQAGIFTDGTHRKARITSVEPSRVLSELEKGRVVVVAGFQGLNPHGDVATLGRGGSDTTAVALAAALDARECEIYTDVDGVYSADPRVVPDARKLECISYEEMLELASLGAKVLQLRSVEYARQMGVTLHVRSSFNLNEGTLVKEVGDMETTSLVSGVAQDTETAKIAVIGVLDVPGIAYKLFSALAERHINVDVIIQGTNRDGKSDIAFTVAEDDLEGALETTRAVAAQIGAEDVIFDREIAKVSVVGAGMRSNPGVASTMFGALAEEGINIQMISTSEIKISCIIHESRCQDAVRAIHKAFNLGSRP